jgi:hypothetical protein
MGPSAPARTPSWPRTLVVVAAAVYLLAIWLDAVGYTSVTAVLPGPMRFFTQVARLFPRAADMTIEWRAQGYRCATGKFEEVDLRPYFAIRAEDKENRFDRAMFFFSHEKKVLDALDAYIAAHEAALGPEHRIGGTMLLSVRIPIPPPGTHEERYERVPLVDLPKSAERKYWYVTNLDERTRRCAEAAP